jgi:hypothetical protein
LLQVALPKQGKFSGGENERRSFITRTSGPKELDGSCGTSGLGGN